MIYLDHAATTPLRPEAREAMEPWLGERFGNPSGVHAVSRRAKDAVEEARERIASALGAGHPLEIVFTGGGTDADNLAIVGAALGASGGVVTTAIEHDAVLESARFVERLGRPVHVVGVDGEGRVDPEEVVAAVDGATAVVSVMTANNETGVIQPVDAKSLERLHCDPPAIGRLHPYRRRAGIRIPPGDGDQQSGAGSSSPMSGHKIGGPQGVGCPLRSLRCARSSR